MTHTPVATLVAIRDRDPDGWQFVKPTDEDYAKFRQWVLDVYGRQAWNDYMNWGRI